MNKDESIQKAFTKLNELTHFEDNDKDQIIEVLEIIWEESAHHNTFYSKLNAGDFNSKELDGEDK